jgi:hypothetical protein
MDSKAAVHRSGGTGNPDRSIIMTKTTLTKTAAIRATQSLVSICGGATSWQVCGPNRVTEPKGPQATRNVTSYTKARIAATEWRAEVVLALMGLYSSDVSWAICEAASDPYADHTLRGLIRVGLAAANQNA